MNIGPAHTSERQRKKLGCIPRSESECVHVGLADNRVCHNVASHQQTACKYSFAVRRAEMPCMNDAWEFCVAKTTVAFSSPGERYFLNHSPRSGGIHQLSVWYTCRLLEISVFLFSEFFGCFLPAALETSQVVQHMHNRTLFSFRVILMDNLDLQSRT